MFLHMIDRKIMEEQSKIQEQSKIPRWQEMVSWKRWSSRRGLPYMKNPSTSDKCRNQWRARYIQALMERQRNIDNGWKWLSQERIDASGYRRLHRGSTNDPALLPKPRHQLYQSAVVRSRTIKEGEKEENERLKRPDYRGRLGWFVWRYWSSTTTTTTMDRKKIKKTTKGATASSTIEGAEGEWIGTCVGTVMGRILQPKKKKQKERRN